MHCPGAHMLRIYKRLNKQDALTLSRAPTDTESLVRWNASLKNIASLLNNHSIAEMQRV